MRTTLLSFLVLFLFAATAAQDGNLIRRIHGSDLRKPPDEQQPPIASTLAFRKASGRYTKEQWRALIDSLWGPGLPTADKLKIFDDFWTLVDQKWGGFPNLVVNWDSLRNVYRPEVAAGVSRGRFAAILSRLTLALNEVHVFTADRGIDSTMGYYPL
jgi:hypothetical protein